ncbi:hypothetical protein DASC09_052530 [Saccharomycopsis crataegensis]|uniref:F-box domain-containing protein n=1 Tax=Saccharomycopsis crataegensis TaxID=43959 RepID=A0AAV5QSW6_9ASCO|nr:hypothetical protein DASC09_052530 [Saccharomycopsis crataegensis]
MRNLCLANNMIDKLPTEIIHQIIDLLPTQDILSICLVSKRWYRLSSCHLYRSIIVTDNHPFQISRYQNFGTILIYNTHRDLKKTTTTHSRIELLNRSFNDNPSLITLVERFTTDRKKVSNDLILLLNAICTKSCNLKYLEYPLSWFKDVTWNINSKVMAKPVLRNILTPSFNDIEDLSAYSNLVVLKVLESRILNSDNRIFKPNELDIIRNLKSLAIEDISFAKKLKEIFGQTQEKINNLRSFTYKIDCLSTFQKDKFDFDVISGVLNFSCIKNFKLIIWYTENIEKYVLDFLEKLNPHLINFENFELKRNIMAYTIESAHFNNTFTLTNINYMSFFNSNLQNLKILQLSGNYVNKSFIVENNKDLFAQNFTNIFQNCQNLRVLIIDEFININNSSKFLKFLYNSIEDATILQNLRSKLKKLATFGYYSFFIDAFDEGFDENVDSTEYDIINYVLGELRLNYLKFSSLDDPSYHFFKFDLENGDRSGFKERVNYIKNLENSIDIHTKFHHKEKSWKFRDKCSCHSKDYLCIIDFYARDENF